MMIVCFAFLSFALLWELGKTHWSLLSVLFFILMQ
jgi:hypothetical protein